MTLREKFKPKVSINTDGEAGRYATECEKIADDYAIEFAEWLNTLEVIEVFDIEDLNIVGELNKNTKTKELLQIFKKEKGL